MSEPFRWGSQINLPAGLQNPHVTALSNGTFLVLSRIGTLWEESGFKAWVYNADGTLKEEKTLEVPSVYTTEANATHFDRYVLNPVAAELPDGRIAVTWSMRHSNSAQYGVAWLSLYGADLQPLGSARPIAGLKLTPPHSDGVHASDDILSLGDGTLVVAYRSYAGEAFVRVVGADGTLSNPVSLGPTFGADTSSYSDFGSVVDLTALSNGHVVAVVRGSTTANHFHILNTSDAENPTRSGPFSIPVNVPSELKSIEVTALEAGRFVVTWTESGRVDGTGTEPWVTVKFQVFNSDGTTYTGPLAFYPSAQDAASVGTPDILALPGGRFALAAQVVPNGFPLNSEVRLAIFNADGERVSDKLLVSKPAAEGKFSVKGLSLLADGRIAVHLSNGIQIVDPRDKAISLKGTAGNDHYIGTAFHDTFEGSAGADKLEGGFGIDFVSFVNAKAGVTASLSGGTRGDAVGDTYISIEGLLGSSFDDVLIGNGSATLKGRGGNDIYYIKTGDVFEEAVNEGLDTVIVGSSYTLKADAQIEVLRLENVSSKTSAHVTGSNIDNDIIGHGGTNTLKGLAGNDLVKASSGNDRVEGGRGSDTLYGGSGNDKLYGGTGTGKDVFVFDTALSRTKNVDQIYDFNPKYDSIQLENKIFTKLGKGSIKGVKFKSDMFVKSTQAQDREDRIVYDSKAGALYYDKDGTGSAAQVKIATLSKNLKLTASDFFVI